MISVKRLCDTLIIIQIIYKLIIMLINNKSRFAGGYLQPDNLYKRTKNNGLSFLIN